MTGACIPLHLGSPIIANGGIKEITYRNQLLANAYVEKMRAEEIPDERLIELLEDHSPFDVDVGHTFFR